MAKQYEFSGFERHESVPELPSPEAERIMDDLLVVKKSRKRARKGKKVDSMIQPPQQPRLQDMAYPRSTNPTCNSATSQTRRSKETS